MKLLMVNSASYTNEDVVYFLKKIFGERSVNVVDYDFKGKDIYNNQEFAAIFEKKLSSGKYDAVMSTDFYPIIAEISHETGIKYISWPYDAPMNVLPCVQMGYETNYIFHFDRIEIEKYKKLGYDRFYHMPLAVRCDKYDRFAASDAFRAEISFMGKLYRSQLDIIKCGLTDNLTAFIDKLIETQLGIRDRWIVDELISEPIINAMNSCYEQAGYNFRIIKEQLSYTISEHITYIDRTTLLEMLGRRHDVHLYTLDYGEREAEILKSVKRHGPVSYVNEMPVLFKSSIINLNSSLRSAQSAIPLRVLDVLGCGGFVLTNAQPEIVEYFENDKELVVFRNLEEALELSDYFLEHEDERMSIARSGYEKVKRNFRYEDKLISMFKIARLYEL